MFIRQLLPFSLLTGLLTQACGDSSASDPAPASGTLVNESSDSSTEGTAAPQSNDGSQTVSAGQVYPYAIWRIERDGGFLVVDISDDADRCAALKDQQADTSATEEDNVVVIAIYSKNSGGQLTTPAQTGTYPVQDRTYRGNSGEQWSDARRRQPGDPYYITDATKIAVPGGQMVVSSLEVATKGVVSGTFSATFGQDQAKTLLSFKAMYCDVVGLN